MIQRWAEQFERAAGVEAGVVTEVETRGLRMRIDGRLCVATEGKLQAMVAR